MNKFDTISKIWNYFQGCSNSVGKNIGKFGISMNFLRSGGGKVLYYWIFRICGFYSVNIQKNIKKNFLPIFFYQCAAGSRHCIAYQGCHTTAWGHFSTVRKPSHTSHTLRNPLHTSHTVKKFHLRDITVQSEKIPDISNTVKILKTGMDQKSVTILETSHTFKRTPLKCRSLCTERISLNRLAYITM